MPTLIEAIADSIVMEKNATTVTATDRHNQLTGLWMLDVINQCTVVMSLSYSLERSRADKVTFSVSSKVGDRRGPEYTVIVRPAFSGLHVSIHGPDYNGLKEMVRKQLAAAFLEQA
jgi:hypothetical protein